MRDLNSFQHGQVAGVAGRSAVVDLDTSRDSRFIIITMRATVTISVATATALRNLGSVWAMVERVRLSESGSDTALGDGRLFASHSEFLRGTPGTQTRLTALTVGATNLVERVMIPFERLQALVPREMRYRVRNPGNRFQLSFDVAAIPGEKVTTPGPATVVITAITFDVRQYIAEPNDAVLPVFAPRWREQIIAVPAASSALRHELDIGGDFIRGITVLQEGATIGTVSDIINSAQLRSDRKIYIGESGPVSWGELAADNEWQSGGNVFSANNGSIVHLDMQTGGKLSKMISPDEALNLRMVFNAQPSVVGGAGASQIRTLLHLASRDEAVGPGGRRVVSRDIPFPV